LRAKKIATSLALIEWHSFSKPLILALNAAVGSRHVQESRKELAVVASEVRTLAQRSANAAKDIKS